LATWAEDEAGFRAFVAQIEPRLRKGLMAAYGADRGREATAEALAVCWEKWDDVRKMANPAGYLYRVGQSRTRARKEPKIFSRPEAAETWVEPGLPKALESLPERQRVVVYLVYAYGFRVNEVASLLELGEATVRTHLQRGLASLRRLLNVAEADLRSVEPQQRGKGVTSGD